VDDSVGWRIPATKFEFSESIYSYTSFVGPTFMYEVNVDELGRLMREIYNNPDEAAAKGKRAAARVANGWTWRHTTNIVIERMHVLRNSPPRIRGIASQWNKRA
jgi:hypothetical protein